MYNKRKIGLDAETIAENYLVDRGFVVVQRNFYTRIGEIDIIAIKDSIYYFVEVKFRSSNKYGSVKESITSNKKRNLKNAVLTYLKYHKLSGVKYKISFLGITRTENSTNLVNSTKTEAENFIQSDKSKILANKLQKNPYKLEFTWIENIFI